MANTIYDKLDQLRDCKADIKLKINNVLGTNTVDDATPFADYSVKMGDIIEIKNGIMEAINETLGGEISDNTPFDKYADAIKNSHPSPQPPEGQYTVTVAHNKGGTIKCEPEDGKMVDGGYIKVTAIPDEGYQISRWSDSDYVLDRIRYIQVTEDLDITVEFAAASKEDEYMFWSGTQEELRQNNWEQFQEEYHGISSSHTITETNARQYMIIVSKEPIRIILEYTNPLITNKTLSSDEFREVTDFEAFRTLKHNIEASSEFHHIYFWSSVYEPAETTFYITIVNNNQ